MRVYFSTTPEGAEQINYEGFSDMRYGFTLEGVMVHTDAINGLGFRVLAIDVPDDAIRPYCFYEEIAGEEHAYEACVPAAILNRYHARLVDTVA
jgi:hypothetical protein